MLTLAPELVYELAKTGKKVRWLVQLYLSSTDSRYFVDGDSVLFGYPPSVLSVNVAGLELDPWTRETTVGSADVVFRADGAVRDAITSNYAGRLAVSPMWRPDSSTYAAQFRTWFAGTGYGYRPFLWIPQPTGNKMEAYFCRTQPALSVAPVNGVEMNVTIPLLEDPPYVERE